MTITVLLFARWRELLGVERIRVELTTPTITELRRVLAATYPNAVELLVHTAIAVNNDYADDVRTLNSNDEIALIPPVSGGNQ